MKLLLPNWIQEAPDSADGVVPAPYDSIWAGSEIPTQPPTPLEQVMLSNDRLYVVLAVVLLIWFGIVALLLRTDRRLRKLERTAEEHISPDDGL